MGRQGRSLPKAWQHFIKEIGASGRAGKVYEDIDSQTLRLFSRMRDRGLLRLVRVEDQKHIYRLSPTGEAHYDRFYKKTARDP